MVDYRSSVVDGRLSFMDVGTINVVDVPKVLEYILKWMSSVISWNVVIMLASMGESTLRVLKKYITIVKFLK
jgi:hypothetical protein